MFEKVLIGLKEGMDHRPLIELALGATSGSPEFHLLSLIRVGTNEDELERLRAAQSRLDEIASQIENVGPSVTTEVGVIAVAAAQDLLQRARELECDLIVIGLGKQGRVGKAIMGSDAQRILIGAHCPILATRLYS